ncbi:MAG: endonuclease/exonuclease/phosphatase family protein [Pseudomonadota bacterium]
MAGLFAAFAFLACSAPASALSLEKPDDTIRVATFNANLNRKGAGVLIKDIAKQDPQVLAVAEIILRVRPDIILINEIDHDDQGIAVDAFRDVLSAGLEGVPGLDYPYRHIGPMNTGVPSGFDLDGDGKIMGARDALGFGRFPGQYGMAVLSRFPIGQVRDFHAQPWADVPWAKPPINPDDTPYYSDEAWRALTLSSKSHWDVSVELPDGRAVHLLASHPTPPVFDGPEDRNGLRNAAEIRFWIDYIDGADWMMDEAASKGGLPSGEHFVVLGDLNADPQKGDGDRATISALANHPRLQDPAPKSPGARAVGQATDTADWPEKNGPENLRVDYILPSVDLTVTGAGVFWPAPDDPLAWLVGRQGRNQTSSDHRLVWVDIAEAPKATE